MFIIAFSISTAIVYYEFVLEKNIKFTSADINDNVFDWAWNSNIGWISFNCASNVDTNSDGLGDQALKVCAGGANQNKVCNAGVAGAADCSGFNCVDACSISNYGVNINTSGQFSGYAWSSIVGWISFNRCGSDGNCLTADGDTGDPPGQPYQNGTFIADYNQGNDQVRGWAKILSMGADGWIKFRKFGSDSGPNYGVSISNGKFMGWAWNANDNGSGIGWISFNCDHTNDDPSTPGGTNTCGVVNYQVVFNNPPAATALTAPNWNYVQAGDDALHANLQFDMVDPDSGSYGSAYQLVVEKADGTPVLNTGKCTALETPSPDCNIDNNVCLKNGATGCLSPGDCVCIYSLDNTLLNYNQGYKWWVTVWDNYNVASPLKQYDTNPDTPIQADDGVALTFTTYMHEFPDVSFTCFPAKPSKGEKVRCTANSQRYFSAPPATAVNCLATTCDWLWTIPADATIDDPTTSTPIIIFNGLGLNEAKLKVADETDTGTLLPYYDEFSRILDANVKLPTWKEVKPE